MIYHQHENSVSTFGRRRLVVRSCMVHFNWSLVLMMPKKDSLRDAKEIDGQTPGFLLHTNKSKKTNNVQDLHGYLQLLDPSIERIFFTICTTIYLLQRDKKCVFLLVIVILLLLLFLGGRCSFRYEA